MFKRIMQSVSVLLTPALVFSIVTCAPFSAHEASPEELAAAISVAAESGRIRGDADGDGTVTVIDATTIQRHLVQIPTPSFNEKAADADDNGLDITDATFIGRWLADITVPCKIGEFVKDNTLPTQEEYELPPMQ